MKALRDIALLLFVGAPFWTPALVLGYVVGQVAALVFLFAAIALVLVCGRLLANEND